MSIENVSGLTPVAFLAFFPMTFYQGLFKQEKRSSVVYSYKKKKKKGSSGTFLAHITSRVQEYPLLCHVTLSVHKHCSDQWVQI